MKTTFYIVRHGQTDWNIEGIMQGQKNRQLTLLGKKQLEATRKQLEKIAFDAIFSSDLDRTRESAEIIRNIRKLLIQESPLLRERSYGHHEGKKLKEFQKFEAILESLDDRMRFSHKMDVDIESDKELMERFQKFLGQLQKTHVGQTVLIVSHGAVIQAFLIMIGYGTYKTLPEKLITNGSYAKIVTDGKQFTVEEVWGITKNHE